MQTHRVTPDLSLAGQIAPADVPAIARAGFRSIVCNRPDAEEPGQPDWHSVEAAAHAAGLATAFVPVGAQHSVAEQRDAFAAALAELPAPVLAYCRTGNRSGQLWEASRTCG